MSQLSNVEINVSLSYIMTMMMIMMMVDWILVKHLKWPYVDDIVADLDFCLVLTLS